MVAARSASIRPSPRAPRRMQRRQWAITGFVNRDVEEASPVRWAAVSTHPGLCDSGAAHPNTRFNHQCPQM